MRGARLIFAASVLAIIPALFILPGAAQSLRYNLPWTDLFASALRSGAIYPRWMPGAFEGLGSPVFYFYPPVAYWISGTFKALGLSTLAAINAAGFCLFLASGLTMHRWLRSIGANANLGAALYVIAPYHLFDFYVRGALAEFVAYAWIPLIAMAMTERRAALMSVAWAGLLMTHLPTAMLVGLFLILPLAIRDRYLPFLALAFGFVLSAIYTLPALTLQDHVSIGHLWNGFYHPSRWSILTRHDSMFVGVQGAIVFGFALLMRWNFWGKLTLFTGLMALSVAPWLWNLPILFTVQFPWRLLSVMEFAAITSIALYPPSRLRAVLGGQFLLFACVVIFAIALGAKAIPRTESPAEYLPNGVDLSGITNIDREIDLSPYRGLARTDRVIVSSPGTYTFGRFAFPIWQVERNGQMIESSGPPITFEADRPGEYRIVRRLLWQEVAGAILSLAALLALLGAGLKRQRPSAAPGREPAPALN